jgi:hypothetical protein
MPCDVGYCLESRRCPRIDEVHALDRDQAPLRTALMPT